MSQFCRHNRFIAECPICAKGTVLDPSHKSSRPQTGTGSARKAGGPRRSGSSPGAARVSQGVYASVGPYEDGREVRLEKVPGGLRLAAWHAGQLVRGAPVLELRDLSRLLAAAAEKEVLGPLALAGADGAAPAAGSATVGSHASSPGRTGELADELRVERVDSERLRIARWVMRPNRGWELQEAPVMLPPARFVRALEAAAAGGVLASVAAG